MPDAPQPSLDQLHAVAHAHGVGTDFWGFYGELTQVSAQTLTAVLSALGVDVSTAEACEQAVIDRSNHAWRQFLPPTIVMREGQPTSFLVHVPDGDPVEVWVIDETGHEWPVYQGEHWVEPRDIGGVRTGEALFWLPELPLGWHTVRARSGDLDGEATLVVVPDRVTTADSLPSRTPRGRTWGLMAQLYSVRSRRSWGIGDIEDLADLSAIAGDAGADWVLVNPLHAAEPVPPLEDSPYLPATRRFFNPIYIRVESIPEASYLGTAARARVEQLADLASAANGDATAIRRDPAYTAKLEALELVYAVPRSPGRARRFARFKDADGRGPGAFCAVVRAAGDPPRRPPRVDELRPRRVRGRGSWPSSWRDRIDFYCWLQWILDEQLETAQATALRSGMAVGIVHDLAVGVHPCGADAWVLRDVLVPLARVGAPPDMYNQQGQNWSQPPWHPGTACGLRVCAVPRHVAHDPAARGRHPGRSRARAVPSVVGAGGAPGRSGHLRLLRPRGAGRDPVSGG
jgi:4-alpha-glucanotransferase